MRGNQLPRVLWAPPAASSAGAEAIELARLAGLILDPWQELVLEHALGERDDGQWAAFEVGLVVARQSGKGALLEARELAGLFLLGERLILHSAHQFDTSLEAFRRLLFLIEDTPDLDRRVKRVSRSHGEEGIELKGGQRIRFRTRTKGGGRGFSADCLIFDEAMYIPEAMHGALLPTLSARPNPQVWYTGSAVDQLVHEHGVVLARVRERGLSAADPALAYFEWSLEHEHPDLVSEREAVNPDAWARSNPGLGIRIAGEHIEREQRSMDHRTFAVERLSVGDWPATDDASLRKITDEAWRAGLDAASRPLDPVCFAFDVTPDRSSSSIAVAGYTREDLAHVELVDSRPGTGWVAGRLAELARAHKKIAIVCDASGPAASLLAELARAGVMPVTVTAAEHAQGCGMLVDEISQVRLRHLDQPELAAAIRGAGIRPLGDAWAWSRKSSTVNISPLVAITLALWGLKTKRRRTVRAVSLAEVLRQAQEDERQGNT